MHTHELKMKEGEVELLLEVLNLFLYIAPNKSTEAYVFAVGLKKVLEIRR